MVFLKPFLLMVAFETVEEVDSRYLVYIIAAVQEEEIHTQEEKFAKTS